MEYAERVADLRAFLEGAWSLTRTVLDRRSGACGRLSGKAIFETEGEGLLYRENGVLRLGARDYDVSQIYRYRFPEPERADITFDHGGYFHTLDLSSGRWSAEHLCNEDLYRGAFRAAGAGGWRVVWRILGPRKDQVLKTRYLRAG